MRVLYLGLRLVTDFVFFLNLLFVCFSCFLIVLLFYKFYIAIINHKQVLCLARKNDSLMILQYSYILIIIFITKGERKKWKKTKKWWTFTAHNGNSNHHLQPLLRVPLVFLLLMCHTDLSSFSDRGHSSSEREESVSNARCHITVNGNNSTFVVFASDRIHRFCTLSILL